MFDPVWLGERRPERPGRVRIRRGKLTPDLPEGSFVTGCPEGGHCLPVQRLRRGGRRRVARQEAVDAGCRLLWRGAAQVGKGEGQGEVGQQLIGRQEADPLTDRGATVMEDDQRGRPTDGESPRHVRVIAQEQSDRDQLVSK